MELIRKIDGKTVKITLTGEELGKAYTEYVQNFMRNELVSQFHLNQKDAVEVTKSAYELYCRGDGHTEYDCIRLAYDEYVQDTLIRSLDDFSDAVRRISDGLTPEEYSVFTVTKENVIEAYAANERLYVETVALSEIMLSKNREVLRRANEKNTLAIFDNRISFVFEIKDASYSSDVVDFCSEVIPSESEWRCGSTSLGILLGELGLA